MPRFSKDDEHSDDEDMLDIYDCGQDMFWHSRDIVEPADSNHYMSTLKIDEGDSSTF